jgi:hypothetical protein
MKQRNHPGLDHDGSSERGSPTRESRIEAKELDLFCLIDLPVKEKPRVNPDDNESAFTVMESFARSLRSESPSSTKYKAMRITFSTTVIAAEKMSPSQQTGAMKVHRFFGAGAVIVTATSLRSIENRTLSAATILLQE